MSILYYFIDEETRKLRPEAAHKVVAQKDHNADVIRVGIPETMNSIALETSAVRCMYQRPKETEVRSKTATYYDTSGGYLWYDWTLQEGDTAKAGKINFSVCLQHIEGGLLTVDWNTTIGEIFVKTSYHSDDGDEGDESITPTAIERIVVLEAKTQRLYSMAGGAPVVVGSASDMTDTDKIYVLTSDGCWYYYDGSAWVVGGEYGAVATDTTLTQSGIPADAEAVGDAIEGLNDTKADKNTVPRSVETDAENTDLDLADPQGNVLVRFANGHIQTKHFNSNDSMTHEDKSEIESELLAVPAVNITQSNTSDMDIADESGNVLMRLADGGIRTKLFDSRRVMPPIVISVKQDGTGDFTSLRYAIDSISDANPETKPYRIEIYPGTYNVFDDFTDEEIATATQDYFVDKDDLSFCGIMLTDGISLRGIGNRDDIIIHGELSPDTWSSDLRNYVSTLNLQGTLSLENVTVTAKYIRYCVHDDQRPEAPYTYRYVKSCKFRISGQTSGFQGKTWGEGSRYGKTTVIEDCDFGTFFAWHSENQGSSTKPQKLIVRDSVASAALIACRNHQIMHQVYLYNVQFPALEFSFANISSTEYRMGVTGNWRGSMIAAPSDWNYTSGDIVKFVKGSLTLGVGAVVKLREDVHPYAPLVVCTNKYSAYGVVVGVDNDWVYVQTDGYINVNRFGLTGLVEGDKLTIGTDGYLEINGTGDAFAVCNWVSQTYGTFVKVV